MRGSLPQVVQATLNFLSGAAGTERFQFRRLLARDGFIDVKNVRRFLLDHKIVHADDDLLLSLHRSLILIGRLGNFFLWIPALDGLDHPAYRVELAEVIEGAVLHLQR